MKTREVSAKRSSVKGNGEQGNSGHKFDLLVQSVKDYAIMMLDNEGRIVEWNEGARRVIGYEEREVMGRHFRLFYTAEDRKSGLPEKEMRVAKLRGRSEEEGWRVRKDGSRFWVNEIVTPIRDETGRQIGYAKISRDLTERKEAEDAARLLNESLEARIRERTSGMRMYQERLRAMTQHAQKVERLERRRIADQLHDHLAQLLALCDMRLAAVTGRHVHDPDLPDVRRYLDQAIQFTRSVMLNLSPPVLREKRMRPALDWIAREMEEHGLKVTIKELGTPRTLNEEIVAAMFQSVRETLFNVVKHARTRKALVVLSRGRDQVMVEVIDKGKGMKRRPREAIGLRGFGLFSSRERMEAIGGSLDVESDPRRGTAVRLMAPIRPAAGGRRERTGAGPVSTSASGKRIKVLIVDDHPQVREGLRKTIEASPEIAVVGEASDGKNALKLIQRLRPEIVLMDVRMPVMDGIQATRQIAGKWHDIGVIGLSIQQDDETKEAMLRAGARAYISKRESAERLLSTIRWWAERIKGK
jgi:PAS domain S-box-containing protein